MGHSQEKSGRFFVSGGFALFWIGALVLGVAVVGPFFIRYDVRSGVEGGLVISNESDGYEEFLSNAAGDQEPVYKVLTFFSLENLFDVEDGDKPQYKEMGPYYFRLFSDKVNVTFMKNKVMYTPQNYYIFDGAKSGTASINDKVTGFNPGYLKLLGLFGSEEEITHAYTSVQLSSWLNGPFSDPYVADTKLHYASIALNRLTQKLISEYQTEKNLSPDEARATVCQIWANDTQIGPVNGITIPNIFKVSLYSNAETGITFDSCNKLLLNSSQYSFVNTDNYVDSVLKQWHNANTEVKQNIMQEYGLTQTQLNALESWISSDNFTAWTTQATHSILNVQNDKDIPLIQMASGSVSESLATLYPATFTEGNPEIYYSGEGTPKSALSLKSITNFFFGDNGILKDSINMNLVNKYIIRPNSVSIKDVNRTWGISDPNQISMIKKSFSSLSVAYNFKSVKPLASLFQTKTVAEWTFNNCDDLFQQFFPNQDCQYILFNSSTPADALSHFKPSVVYTGSDKIGKVYVYEKFNGANTTVIGNVTGSSSSRQYLPFVKPYQFQYFDADYLKDITLVPGSVSVNGSSYQFVYEDSTWDAENVTGLCSMGPAYENIPYYIGNPYLYGVDKEYLVKITGIEQPSENTVDKPLFGFLAIDSFTGVVTEGNLCSQLNLFLKTETIQTFFNVPDFNHANIPKETIWPLYYQREYSTSSPSQNHKIEELSTLEQNRLIVFQYTSYITGGILALMGLILFIIGIPRINKKGYVMIN
eukprot:TRINITY_DN7912_c0_g1_i1.p1 TRINITY_DN7912_c0_g1~~TRINITY_DN7912_c0_g1_i1.p1  ORF type:complete len:774 (-),score=144.80 TRINITY_DN7912_c0_g1_i1:73-2355(-)